MKKIFRTLFLFSILSQINAQQLVLRTNLFSHLRPNPTINLNIGLITGKNKSIEYYLSLEKAYASFDNVVRGVFKPDNSKLNLEYGLGFKKGLSKKSNNKNKYYFFSEVEYARLNYSLITAQTTQGYNGYYGTTYASNGFINSTKYNFSRIQFLAGIGSQIRFSKQFGICFNISIWNSNHFSISRSNIISKFIGESIKNEVNKFNSEFHIFNDSPTQSNGSSDQLLDSKHKLKIGAQLGLSLYYIFGK